MTINLNLPKVGGTSAVDGLVSEYVSECSLEGVEATVSSRGSSFPSGMGSVFSNSSCEHVVALALPIAALMMLQLVAKAFSHSPDRVEVPPSATVLCFDKEYQEAQALVGAMSTEIPTATSTLYLPAQEASGIRFLCFSPVKN